MYFCLLGAYSFLVKTSGKQVKKILQHMIINIEAMNTVVDRE